MSSQLSALVRKAVDRHEKLRLRQVNRLNHVEANQHRRKNQHRCSSWVAMKKVYGVEASSYEKFMVELFSSDQFDHIADKCTCVVCWYQAFFKLISTRFEFARYLDRLCPHCNLIHVSYRYDFKLVFMSIFKGEVDTTHNFNSFK